MRNDSLVLRNSLFIGLQPLILNIVSIFVTGFIARTLGQEDYGRFVFAFAFIALLLPIGNLGLRAVTVRDIAANKEQAVSMLGKVFSLRIVLSILAFLTAVVLVHALGYPPVTRKIVYIAGLTLLTQTAATTYFDMFQAFQRMQFIAIANLVSGTLLTAASIVVLLMGYRLIGLTAVYTGGGVILLITIAWFYKRNFPPFRLAADRGFWLSSLKKGIPFFVVGMLSILNIRIGIVLLSKMSGDASVGLYGAAFSLVERLNVIAESTCTAIFPTFAVLFAASQIEELNKLLAKFLQFLLIISLPVAIGTTLLRGEIIGLIFGDAFAGSAPVLAALTWNLPLMFVASLMGYCLGAINLQPLVVRVAVIAATLNVVLNVVLIPLFDAFGVAAAYLSVGVLSSIMTFVLIRRALGFRLPTGRLLRLLMANVVLAVVVILVRELNWIASIAAGAASYAVSLFALRAVDREDIELFRDAVTRKRKVVTTVEPE